MIDKRKKYIIALDTETANPITFPLPYDAGWAVADKHGNIYEKRSYVVYEIYCKEREKMKSAYYAEKLPQYEKDIKEGKRKLASIWTIYKQFRKDMEDYNTKTVCAYNMGFDRRALNNDMKYLSSWVKWFFPKDTEFQCIWNMACSCILNRPSYIKFAEENNFISDKGNILTNAEVCYKYITKDLDFKESHTGLEDVLIELEIMALCYRQHKPFEKTVYSACWRKVQEKRKEMSIKEDLKNNVSWEDVRTKYKIKRKSDILKYW